ncbi:hypothetical protein B0H13DRAFT_2349123 [Mycena leptocephala]|nr:hypothetical protein B0H13DRAFT_2349123 [Mycena leptocephala]
MSFRRAPRSGTDVLEFLPERPLSFSRPPPHARLRTAHDYERCHPKSVNLTPGVGTHHACALFSFLFPGFWRPPSASSMLLHQCCTASDSRDTRAGLGDGRSGALASLLAADLAGSCSSAPLMLTSVVLEIMTIVIPNLNPEPPLVILNLTPLTLGVSPTPEHRSSP